MTKGKWDVRKLVAAGVLLVVGLVSFFWLAKTTADPAFHAASIAALDEKKVTAMELTAATAAGSVAISAVPGDATTPIANQISELSGYLLIVVGAIMLEKLLLSLTCYAAFQFLIPIACVLGIVYLFAHIEWCRVLARKLALFGIVICLIVPASIQVTRIVDETFQIQQTVDDAEQAVEQPADPGGEGGQLVLPDRGGYYGHGIGCGRSGRGRAQPLYRCGCGAADHYLCHPDCGAAVLCLGDKADFRH